MLSVGLTGGIGSGKSTVSALLAAHGAAVVDADALAREVVAPGTAGLARLVEAFGEEVLDESGGLDRDRLGRLVFADPQARAVLNAIVHPLVGELSAERVAEAEAGGALVVVHDVPLLVENGLAALYDLVVVVDAPEEVRVRRLVELRGMDEQQARARMAAQATRDERLEVADEVIDNSGDRSAVVQQVAELWDRLTARASGV